VLFGDAGDKDYNIAMAGLLRWTQNNPTTYRETTGCPLCRTHLTSFTYA